AVDTPINPEAVDTPINPGAVDTPINPGAVDTPINPGAVDTPNNPEAVDTPINPEAVDTPINPGGTRKPKDPSSFNKLTGAYKLTYFYKRNYRINKTKKELSDIEYKDFSITSMYLIRSLLESYVNEYIDLFTALPREHEFKMKGIAGTREKRKGKELQDLIYNHIKNHLKETIRDSETSDLIEVTFSKSNNISATKILNYYIHSSTNYPSRDEVLSAWSKISQILNTLDKLLGEISGQK
ncbi:hypothetical protein ACFVSH_13145, partial [Peribacillus sp. NPDC058002]